MKLQGKTKEMDYRVSVLPTLFGEKIVLRLLDKDNLMLDMTKLGFEAESLLKFERQILKPYGMVLVTGPTGSGKTNTLYSSMNRVNTPETNIMTAEDPVEFNLHGINQVQTNEKAGLTFATGLKALLRQDPDTILVGEIRDFETAEIAIKAALTGAGESGLHQVGPVAEELDAVGAALDLAADLLDGDQGGVDGGSGFHEHPALHLRGQQPLQALESPVDGFHVIEFLPNNLLAAVAAASVVSLGVAAMFVILEAPDVAMTEAAVGAGLSGLILALALRRIGLIRLNEARRGDDPDA